MAVLARVTVQSAPGHYYRAETASDPAEADAPILARLQAALDARFPGRFVVATLDRADAAHYWASATVRPTRQED